MAQAKKKKSKGRTPLMRQYWKIKDEYPHAILLFRMGDFYEAFDKDANLISGLLGIQLTTRSNGAADDVPMAGFPHHSLDNYLPKLIREGHRVAVCEQIEDAKNSGKIVKRDVVEVVTPGVSFHDQLLDPKQSNYLAAVHWGTGRNKDRAGFAFIDATTGEFAVTEIPAHKVNELLQTVAPAELLFDKRQRNRIKALTYQSFVQTRQEDWVFGYDFAYETLLSHFETHSLKGFGVDDLELGVVAAGAALHYLGETQKGKVPHIRRITRYEDNEYMTLDPETKRNLELVTSLQEGGREGSLIEILDHALTPMGGRLLRQWLVRPLRKVDQVERRLDAVDTLYSSEPLRSELRKELQQVGDLERLISKVCTGRARPRDLINLKLTLRQIPPVKTLLEEYEVSAALQEAADQLQLCREIVEHIQSALVDDPPNKISEGGLMQEGYSEELDELRQMAASGKEWVAQLEKTEAERTNIPSLKVSSNKVFGYYIEVTKTHTEKVPDNYIRKQTLVNSERYITPELKEYEEKILTAKEKIEQLEQRLFNELRMAVAEKAEPVQRNARLLAGLDCFSALAHVAVRMDYVRPDMHDGQTLDIKGGRHPVVEQTLPAGDPFIPNDIYLDPADEQVMIITGPNMAGKSVVLRQTGLIVLLAQVGSFVPAEKASIGVVDQIFTRVGASDNLAAGESTFLVEMNETANILNNATPNSLILLDEVGRGTSTFDGLSIAWALVEYLHENPRVSARTLFATHYHELNALSDRYERVRNARIKVKEHDGDIIFLRKLISGGADHSYGIEVARMAGLPDPVIERAKDVLKHLEAQDLAMDEEGDTNGEFVPQAHQTNAASTPPPREETFQRSLFEADPVAAELKTAIEELEPNAMTPIEALMKLAELKQQIAEE